ncbi:hypothetical protein BWR60_27030 [Inquilinus limosus]|uniref:Uncharacterized protein n=1 Tax=Inquilinus limosus TaxID=171674 RepID=A0A211ZFQ3_9PROT|nr:hypothetical protein BWR60_27030 [Inquilinus limosus]
MTPVVTPPIPTPVVPAPVAAPMVTPPVVATPIPAVMAPAVAAPIHLGGEIGVGLAVPHGRGGDGRRRPVLGDSGAGGAGEEQSRRSGHEKTLHARQHGADPSSIDRRYVLRGEGPPRGPAFIVLGSPHDRQRQVR